MKLFTEHLEKQQRLQKPPVQPIAPQQQRLTFKFLDSFETAHNGAQQWMVRKEVGETAGASPVKPQKVAASERTTRTLFADSSFESTRVPPVDLGQTRSSVNRFQPSADQTQAAAQTNGFHASVHDL
jgi:hypothetical protein